MVKFKPQFFIKNCQQCNDTYRVQKKTDEDLCWCWSAFLLSVCHVALFLLLMMNQLAQLSTLLSPLLGCAVTLSRFSTRTLPNYFFLSKQHLGLLASILACRVEGRQFHCYGSWAGPVTSGHTASMDVGGWGFLNLQKGVVASFFLSKCNILGHDFFFSVWMFLLLSRAPVWQKNRAFSSAIWTYKLFINKPKIRVWWNFSQECF